MNEPRIVPEAQKPPGRCLASRDVEGPFIDVGIWTGEHDPYLYLSVRWVEEIARNLLGMVSRQEIDERYAKVEAELKEQAEKLAELERFEEKASEFERARLAVLARSSGEPEAISEMATAEGKVVSIGAANQAG